MAFWVTGSDEREIFAKAGNAARLLYEDGGGWAMEQVYKKRGELPDESWFIPSSLVRDWGKKNAATALVREGFWKHAERDGVKGFTYSGWIRWENTPEALRQRREGDRDAQRQHRSAKRVVRSDPG
jgi:hypothetical protein